MTRALAWMLACLATLTAGTMAASAAWDRGGTSLDRALLVALSVAVVAGVHLIPALSRERFKWALWAGCLICTVYGHLTFFVHAGMRAGEARAQQSVQVTGAATQIQTARDALASITARPVAVVAAQLADTHGRRARAALRLELEEARRAERLQDKLATLETTQTQAEVTGATDPVIARLAAVTGMTEASISLAVGLTFSLLLELLGAVLWVEALRPMVAKNGVVTEKAVAKAEGLVTKAGCNSGCNSETALSEDMGEAAPASGDDFLAGLRQAIAEGRCRATVAGIRVHVGCSQARALELRRALNG